jgi:REP element-mobilizing transposase RayT
VETVLYDAVREKTRAVDGRPVRLGGIEDHMHLVAVVPPTLPVARFVQAIKTYSCYRVRQAFGREAFRWQRGYGAFTALPHHLDGLLAYVDRQKEHHAADRVWTRYEQIAETE